MSFLIEIVMAFFLGIIIFAFMPVYTLGYTSDWFIELAMNAVGRAILLKRANAGFTLKASRYNSEDGTEQISVSGQTYDFEDPHGYMSRFKKKPFGLAHEKRGTIITPRECDMGRKLADHKREGTLRDDGGRYRKYFAFEPGRALVNVDHALNVIQGSAKPTLATTVKEYVKKGQLGFNTSRAMTYGIWLMMFGVGAGTPWLLNKVKETGGGGLGNPIPGMAHLPDVVGVLL